MMRMVLLFSSFLAVNACSHIGNEAYLRQGCINYGAALNQLAQMRHAGMLTPDLVAMVDGQNGLVVGDPSKAQYGVCTTSNEPSNPSGADDTVKYGRNVLRGAIDTANRNNGVSTGNHTAPLIDEAASAIHLDLFENPIFDSWTAIRSSVIVAKASWDR